MTTSPDVTVSTNLGAWVNRRGIFDRAERADTFREEKVVSAQRWAMSPQGQHIELGIAESNLFLQLAALGLAGPLFGARLLPIGTLYDPFIKRGLDALNYALYQDARFILVATPSGITLAPEGGAHQSVIEPLIGHRPARADRHSSRLMPTSWRSCCAGRSPRSSARTGEFGLFPAVDPAGRPARARRSTRRSTEAIVAGAYWLREPAPGAELAIAYCGAVAPEALAAHEAILEDVPGAGLLAITSPGAAAPGLAGCGCGRCSEIGVAGRLLRRLRPGAALVTVADAHPATLSWLGSVAGNAIVPLGVDHFGQSGDIPDLYRAYGSTASDHRCRRARLLASALAGNNDLTPFILSSK